MTRKISLVFLLATLFTAASAQQSVSIGTTNTNTKAVLYLSSPGGNQGLIVPVVSSRNAVNASGSADRGMIVYDQSDNSLYYYNGTTWLAASGGTGGGGGTLSIAGNTITLSNGGGSVNIASGGVTGNGQLLMWNGTAWVTTPAPAANGQILKWNGTSWALATDNGTAYTAGTGISITGTTIANTGDTNAADDVTATSAAGGDVTGTFSNLQIAAGAVGTTELANTAVTAGTYGNSTNVAQITVDAKGRVTSATNVAIAGGGASTLDALTDATVTSPAAGQILVNDGAGQFQNRTVSGDIQMNATGQTTLANTAVTAGTYGNATNIPQITVDSKGRITAATLVPVAGGGASTLDALTDATVTSPSAGQILINDGAGQFQNRTVSGDVAINSTGTTQLTSASGTNVVSAVNNGATTGTINTNRLATGVVLDTETPAAGDVSGTFAAGLNIGAGRVTLDKITTTGFTDGQVLKFQSGAWVAGTDNTGGGTAPTLNNGQIIVGNGTTNSAAALSGDATLNVGVLTLANTGATAGTYGNTTNIPQLTIDSKGRVTSATNIPVTTGATTLDGLTDATVNTPASGQILIHDGAGQFQNRTVSGDVTINNTGTTQITSSSGTNIVSAVNNGATTGTIATNRLATGVVLDTETPAAGDVAGTFAAGLTLANTAVTAGTYGNATNIPQITVDSKGRITAATLVPVAGGGASTLDALTDATVTSPTAGQILINDGAGQFQNRTVSGDVVINSTGTTQIANNAAAGTNIINAVNSATGGSINTARLNTAVVLDTENPAAGDITGNYSTGFQVGANAIGATEIATGAVTTGKIAGAGPGVRAILGSDNNTVSWVTGSPDQLLGTDGTGALSFTSKTNFMSGALTSGQIFVGSATNVATGVAMTGDVGINNTGVTTIANGAVSGGTGGKISDGTITNADISASAAIAGTKVAPNFGSQNVTTTGSGTFGGGLTSGSTGQFTISNTGNITRINGVTTSFPAAQGTAGQVLTNDGAGVLSWASPTTFSTANTIPRGNGTTLVASSIFDNGAYTAVGNRTTPVGSSRFDVEGTAAANTYTGMYINGTDAQSWPFYGYGTAGSPRAWTYYNGATSEWILDNVGARLTVGAAGQVGFSGSFGTAGQVLTSQGAGAPPIWSSAAGGWGLTGNTLAGTERLGSDNAQPLVFETNNTERLRIDANGNLGFGTISPAGKTHIFGTGNLGLVNESTNTNGTWQTISNTSAGGQIFSLIATGSTNGQGAGKLVFTANSGLGVTVRDIISMNHSNGNVGIGTSTANAPLQLANGTGKRLVLYEVANNNTQYSGFGVAGTGTMNYQVPATTDAHVFLAATSPSSSSELMRITGAGRVGIGTATPLSGFHMENANWDSNPLYLSASAGTAGSSIRFTSPDPSARVYDIIGSTGVGSLPGAGSFGIWDNTGSAYRFVISPTGNIGIGGTTTPNAPLQIANGTGRRLVVWEQANNDHEFMGLGVGGSGTLNYQIPVNSNAHVFQTAISSTASSELMRITGTGDVGIGTSSPSEKLHVAGGANNAIQVSGFTASGAATARVVIGAQSGLSLFPAMDREWTIESSSSNAHALDLKSRTDATLSPGINFSFTGSSFLPGSDALYTLGSTLRRWTTVHATNGTIQTSDERLKTNIKPLEYGLATVLQYRPVSYSWKNDASSKKIGLIAQEVDKLTPEVVFHDEYLGMNYAELVPVLIKAIQEQQKLIDELRMKAAGADETKAQLEALRAEIDEIKKLLGAEAKK